MKNIEDAYILAKQFGYSPFLTSTEASKLLKKSNEWLQSHRKNGTGPRYMKLGNAKNAPILYHITDLLDYVFQNQIVTVDGESDD